MGYDWCWQCRYHWRGKVCRNDYGRNGGAHWTAGYRTADARSDNEAKHEGELGGRRRATEGESEAAAPTRRGVGRLVAMAEDNLYHARKVFETLEACNPSAIRTRSVAEAGFVGALDVAGG